MGGQERVALDLAGGQVRRGHHVVAISLAALPHGVLAEEFVARGVAVSAVPKGAAFDPRAVIRLARLLRGERIDVVHTHNPQPLAYGAPAGRLARIAVVHTKHGVNPDVGRRLWLRRFGGHLAHAYVAVSEATAAVARRNRECRPARLSIIPNGVDLEAYGPDADTRAAIRAELELPADAWVFGTVGRVSVEKDHSLLLRAAGPLLGPKVRLVIVGDGAELPRVRAEASRYAPWVLFTGLRRDVPRLLAALDVFVLSSRTEGLPLALLEAMATGLAAVSTDVGGVSEVAEQGRAALLVRPADDTALRDALRTLANDPGAARALGRRARERSRRYDTRRSVDEYLALYRTAIALSVR